MFASARSDHRRRAGSARALALAGLTAPLLLVTGPVSSSSAVAAPAVNASAVNAPGAGRRAAAASTVEVSDLALTGTSTSVTVRRIYRSGQARWVSHVLDTRLVDLDGCQAVRTPAVRRQSTYRADVRAVCTDGPARSEAAARRLVADRPWYRVSVTRVPLVAFTLLAESATGDGSAMDAALATLPNGVFTFADGDDVSLNYAGVGVTQTQLDAAISAFARALGVPVSTVTVLPLAEG